MLAMQHSVLGMERCCLCLAAACVPKVLVSPGPGFALLVPGRILAGER